MKLPLVGGFLVSNALVAAGLAIATGSDISKVLGALENLKGASGRLEFAGEKNGAPIFIDYAHTPDALEQVLGLEHVQVGQDHGTAHGVAGEGEPVQERLPGAQEGLGQAVAHEHGTGDEAQRKLEEVSIRQSLANLRSFPFVAEREKNGTLKLLGCHFSIRDGELWLLDEADDIFRPV